jgi:hypothetical protein
MRAMSRTTERSAMSSVYDGRVCIGFILKRGKAGVEALDANCTSLGLFATEPAAADAVTAAIPPSELNGR